MHAFIDRLSDRLTRHRQRTAPAPPGSDPRGGTAQRTRRWRRTAAVVAISAASLMSGGLASTSPALASPDPQPQPQRTYCEISPSQCELHVPVPHRETPRVDNPIPDPDPNPGPDPCACEIRFRLGDVLPVLDRQNVESLLGQGVNSYRFAAVTADPIARVQLERDGLEQMTRVASALDGRSVTVAEGPRPDPWAVAAGADVVAALDLLQQAKMTRDPATVTRLQQNAHRTLQQFATR